MAVELRDEVIPIEKAEIAEENVRFEDEVVVDRALQRNIRSQGLFHDVVGRWDGDRFKIIIGRNRFHALKALGAKEIKAKVTTLEGYEAIIASLSENVFKRELNMVLRVKALKKLVEMDILVLQAHHQNTYI